jgi:predicted Ser/Thr protein kinase
MGTVYRAMDADGRTVALKLIHPASAADPASRARLRREVQLLQRIRTPRVARILDAEIDSNEAFVVMEYVDGESLEASVKRDGALTTAEVAELAAWLAAALEEVHEAGVIHRDLKPGNIMLGEAGPVLIDFGIAQEGDATRLTGTGLVIGTPGYVAPELIAGGEPTTETDEWGMAAVLTFAATARPPFGEGRFDVVLGRVARGAADLEGLPAAVADALTHALAVLPDARLGPWDLADALAAAADGRALNLALTAPTRAFPPSRREPAPYSNAGYAAAPLPYSEADDAGPTAPYAYPPRAVPANAPPGWGAPVPPSPWAVQAPGGAPPGWAAGAEPVRRARRGGVVFALACALVATASLNLTAGIVLGAVLAVIGRTVGVSGETLRGWRAARGPRAGDGARIAAAAPFSLVRAVIGLAPAAALGSGLGWGGYALVTRVIGWPGGAEALGLLAAGGLALGLLALWAGPGGWLTRRGVGALLGWVAPGPRSAWAVALAALVWTALVALGWRGGGPWVSPLP